VLLFCFFKWGYIDPMVLLR